MTIVSIDRINKVKELLKTHLKFNITLQYENAIDQTIQFLNSPHATQELLEDPYWPKWNSSWWHILSLIEIDKIESVPQASLVNLAKSIEINIIPFFPLVESELTPTIDPYRNIICHCALGSFIKINLLCDLNYEIPSWIEVWFEKYQITDGGYNCDDEAYNKVTPKSSLVSTLPMLEALLLLLSKNKKVKNKDKLQSILDTGVNYFLNRNLIGSSSNKTTAINPNWIKLTFPRFYELDALRILRFIQEWSQFKGITFPVDSSFMALDQLCSTVEKNGQLSAGFHMTKVDNQSLCKQVDQSWKFEEASRFPLLNSLESPQVSSYFLSLEFLKFLDDLEL